MKLLSAHITSNNVAQPKSLLSLTYPPAVLAQGLLALPAPAGEAGFGEPSQDTQPGEPSSELSRGAPRLAITAGSSQGEEEASGVADTPHLGDHPATSVALVPADQRESGGSVTDRLLHDMAAMNDQRITSNRIATLAAASAAAPTTGAAPAAAAPGPQRGAPRTAAATAAGAPEKKRRAPRTAAAPAATAAAPAAAARQPSRVAAPAGKTIAKKRPSVNHESTRKTFRVRLADGTSKGFLYSSEEDKEAARQKALAFCGEQA